VYGTCGAPGTITWTLPEGKSLFRPVHGIGYALSNVRVLWAFALGSTAYTFTCGAPGFAFESSSEAQDAITVRIGTEPSPSLPNKEGRSPWHMDPGLVRLSCDWSAHAHGVCDPAFLRDLATNLKEAAGIPRVDANRPMLITGDCMVDGYCALCNAEVGTYYGHPGGAYPMECTHWGRAYKVDRRMDRHVMFSRYNGRLMEDVPMRHRHQMTRVAADMISKATTSYRVPAHERCVRLAQSLGVPRRCYTDGLPGTDDDTG